MNRIINITDKALFGAVFAIIALTTACTDAVEKTDLGSITDDVVWKDVKLVRGYFENTVYNAMPSAGPQYRHLGHTDEGYTFESSTDVVYDNFNVNNTGNGWSNVDTWTYGSIRNINRFLDHAGYDGFASHQPIASTLPQAEKEDMIGHLLILRAYHYFNLTRTYGGVPLLIHEQEATQNFEDLQTPRSKTSECIAQVIKDLDAAIALPDASFPMKRSDGHFGKAVAYALKGKVLLYYASPQFTKQTPSGTKSADQRWNEAYTACKEAYDKLKAAGFGLYAEEGGDRQTVMNNYQKMLVTDEMNKEVVWVLRCDPTISSNGWDKDFRPNSSSGAGRSPVWEMVAAFANADGSPYDGIKVNNDLEGTIGTITEGANKTQYDIPDSPDGSAINTSVFWLDREPRFYAFVGYNGCEWPLIRKSQGDFASDVKNGKMQHEWLFAWGLANDVSPFDNGWTTTNGKGKGFFVRKLISDDRNYELPGTDPLKGCGTDIVYIRFAEVALNYAEAAAKTGKNQEAYDVLDALRKRAGIPEGGNHYGIGRKTGDALVFDVLHERRIELFIEGQRYYDARRWRLYSDGLNGYKINGLRRHAIEAWLKDKTAVNNKAELVAKLQGIIDAGGIETEEGRKAYFDVFYHVVMLYDVQPISYNPDRQDFMRIPYDDHIRKNPLIEQTAGWTDERGPGKFNPYE